MSSSEDAHAGMTTFREHEDPRHVCCLCGCEDNEYFEPLVGFSLHLNFVMKGAHVNYAAVRDKAVQRLDW